MRSGRQNKVVELCQPKFPLTISNSVTEYMLHCGTALYMRILRQIREKFDSTVDITTPEMSTE